MDEFVPFGSEDYLVLFGVLVLARGLDCLSTWIATPRLLLEANPIARFLGWRWGLVLNAMFCGLVAAWPFPAIAVATTSLLVAARNFQSAWLMRTMGEGAYRAWLAARVDETHRGLFLGCLAGQTAIPAFLGGGLIYFGDPNLIPVGIGFGILFYGVAVLLFTLLSLRRLLRPAG